MTPKVDVESRTTTDDHLALRLWLRLLSCTNLIEAPLRSRLREHPRLTEVARTLHLSERSLRRRLADSGRIFREIHDRVRAERALELLHAGQLSVADIGIELGFSDPREFRRAFKRWTGMPPQSARRGMS